MKSPFHFLLLLVLLSDNAFAGKISISSKYYSPRYDFVIVEKVDEPRYVGRKLGLETEVLSKCLVFISDDKRENVFVKGEFEEDEIDFTTQLVMQTANEEGVYDTAYVSVEECPEKHSNLVREHLDRILENSKPENKTGFWRQLYDDFLYSFAIRFVPCFPPQRN